MIELESSLRRTVDLESLIGRVSMTLGASFFLVLWLAFVARTRAELPVAQSPRAIDFAWRAALSSALAAGLLSGTLRLLPGFRTLEERSWEAGAPLR